MHEDEERRPEERGLTTEQFARSGDEERPLYPGEATADDTRGADRGEQRQEADLTDAEESAYGSAYGDEGAASPDGASAPEGESGQEALLPEREAEGYRNAWGEI
ncbi:hypothetical protein ACFXJJ_27195, partial [Streptomyces sp. NPDC059233]